jgi:hypothetical protein
MLKFSAKTPLLFTYTICHAVLPTLASAAFRYQHHAVCQLQPGDSRINEFVHFHVSHFQP